MEAPFEDPSTVAERKIKGYVDKFPAAQAMAFEEEIFKQRKRMADAGRSLAVTYTKAAPVSKRIATSKIGQRME